MLRSSALRGVPDDHVALVSDEFNPGMFLSRFHFLSK